MASSNPKSKDQVRVAVVQTASVAFDLEACLKRLETYTKTVAENGADLVLFPEAFLSAYPRGSMFGADASMHDYYGQAVEVRKAGREKYRRYWESSIEIPGPTIDRLSTIAKSNRIFLVVGVIERELGTLYCTVVHFNDQGEFLGKHRKLVPTFYERLVWGRGDGSTLPVFDSTIGKFGSVICYENYMPLVRMNMYQKGIQIYLAPNADGSDEWNASMRHIALEGRCFVLSCNQFNRKSDFPEGFLDADYHNGKGDQKTENYVLSHGGSCIVNPVGKIIAGPVYDEEKILYADLDLGDCIRGKLDVDVTGHYSRPDVFHMSVNQQPQLNVIQTPQTSPSSIASCHQNAVIAKLHELEQSLKSFNFKHPTVRKLIKLKLFRF